MRALPVNLHRLTDIMDRNCYYVDKTHFLKQLIDMDLNGAVLEFNRPRHFGKTLILDMVRAFFDCRMATNNLRLFESLHISHISGGYMQEQGGYPVISLSLGDIHHSSWDEYCTRFKTFLNRFFRRFPYLWESDKLSEADRRAYMELSGYRSSLDKYAMSLGLLMKWLAIYHERPVIVLIDDCDAPWASAVANGYTEEMAAFLSEFLGTGLRENVCLKFAILTGVLGLPRASVLEGFDNLAVDTVFDDRFSKVFGFSQEEIDTMIAHYEVDRKAEELRLWYGGYQFGSADMYNPSATMGYFEDGCAVESYWSNGVIHKCALQAVSGLSESGKDNMRVLSKGGVVNSPLQVDFSYDGILSNEQTFLSYLVQDGYLKAVPSGEDGNNEYVLHVPNYSIARVYTHEFAKLCNA